MKLKDKVAIVTGACSGIGNAIAMKFLNEGAKVVFVDVNEINVDEYASQAIFIKADISKSSQVTDLIKETIKKFNGLDIMVNNAGIGGEQGNVMDISDAGWQKTIDINLSGVFYGVREAAKVMKEQKVKGSIINMSSILGSVGFPGAVAYCASKGGIVQLTKASALDLAGLGIRVNAIAPGFIKTNMTKSITENKDFLSLIEQSTPLGYMGEPEDIANAALYLASDDSKYVTGTVIYVDGGWTAR
ncbi:MAG: SDR family NAD(P)-dependent oxidoreductase [Candidatus Paceibacterota bacterium]